jgi:amino acid transporter
VDTNTGAGTAQPGGQGIKTELREGAVGLPGILMQGIATIAPAFAILASFVFITTFAGVNTPWAYVFGGALLAVQALSAAQLAKAFPSAGGWYTWIARALHPRAGFFAGTFFSVWLPPVGALTLSLLGATVLEPALKDQYGWHIPYQIWPILGLALVAWWAYAGIVLSERLLIITGLIEIAIMVVLAITSLASPGPGGFSFAPLNPGNFHLAPNLFLGVVFSIFAFSGWESVGPMAEESKNPRRNVPIGLVGSVIILMAYFAFVTWGYLVGFGVSRASEISFDIPFPVTTVAERVWGDAWVLLLFALLNSAIAVTIACFNGGTRTWYGMARSGVLPAGLAKVAPTRKTPDNAITLELGVNVLAFALVLLFGAENTFFTWANMITLALIFMYALANIGVIRYYRTEARSQFNPMLHVVAPLVATIAGIFVVWKSYFSPNLDNFWSFGLPKPFTGPVAWGLLCFLVLVVITVIILIILKVRGREDWLQKAQLVFEESGGGH